MIHRLVIYFCAWSFLIIYSINQVLKSRYTRLTITKLQGRAATLLASQMADSSAKLTHPAH